MSERALLRDSNLELHQLFRRFTESSSKLEEKYEELRRESEDLRAQLRQKEIEIKRAEKMATLGETAGAIAHEVRNPLGAIKLFVSLLAQDLQDQPESLALISGIDKSIISLENVVSNILQFSKNKRPQVAPINLHAIIQEQVDNLALLKGEQIPSIELQLKANPFLIASAEGIRQILTNLLSNAAQATPSQGKIEVITEDLSNEKLRLTISDTGVGIAAGVADTIFEPFVTTKNEGTGLGLAIVKKIVDQHQGTITARNTTRAAHGAEFTIELPRFVRGE